MSWMLRLAGVLLMVTPALAEVPEVSVQLPAAEPDAGAFHLGRPVPLRVMVNLPPGFQITSPPVAAEVQEELILRPFQPASGEARPGGGSIREYDLALVPLELGELTFPGVVVAWVDENGEVGRSLSGPLSFTVQAAVDEPLTAEPADIRGPASLPVPTRIWLMALLLAALATGLGLLWWWLRRRAGAEATVEVAPPVDPFGGLDPARWAMDALNQLLNDDLLGRKGAAHFHVRLAEIVRKYLGGQFHIPTLERTTREILQDAERRLRPLPATRQRLQEVLGSCDLVKFAKLQPQPEESLAAARSAMQVVEETRPPEVSPSPREGM